MANKKSRVKWLLSKLYKKSKRQLRGGKTMWCRKKQRNKRIYITNECSELPAVESENAARVQSCYLLQAANGVVTYYEIYSACFISREIMQTVSWVALFWHCEHLRASGSAKSIRRAHGIWHTTDISPQIPLHPFFQFCLCGCNWLLHIEKHKWEKTKMAQTKRELVAQQSLRYNSSWCARFPEEEKKDNTKMRMARKFNVISVSFSLCASFLPLIVGKFSGWSIRK